MNKKLEVFTLTEMQFAKPEKGADYKLYIFDADGFHRGGQWFTSGKIKYPEEQINIAAAKSKADIAIEAFREVRICDGGDNLVAHWLGGKQIYPDKLVDVWSML